MKLIPMQGIEQMFRTVVKAVIRESYIMLDEKGIILTWNKQSETLHGYTPAQIQNQNYSILFLPEERQNKVPALLEEAAAKGSVISRVLQVRKDGTLFNANQRLVAVKNAENQLLGFESYISKI
jgi:PAS domain S-box-containing protein